jgi:hypothetical protein
LRPPSPPVPGTRVKALHGTGSHQQKRSERAVVASVVTLGQRQSPRDIGITVWKAVAPASQVERECSGSAVQVGMHSRSPLIGDIQSGAPDRRKEKLGSAAGFPP